MQHFSIYKDDTNNCKLNKFKQLITYYIDNIQIYQKGKHYQKMYTPKSLFSQKILSYIQS